MNMKQWIEEVKLSSHKKALPILSFPSVQLLGCNIQQLTCDSDLQARGMQLVAEQCDTLAAVSMMDLSVEAEAFGAEIRFSEDEVPAVVEPLITTMTQAQELAVPETEAGRCGLYIDTIRKAVAKITDRPVLAGVIGPYSLAGRLMDVTEIMINCYMEPEMVHTVLQKATEFLIRYIRGYKEAGAHGVVMAEPLTGMLSPDLAREFSEPYVRQIVEAVQEETFMVVYHNCGDNILHMADSIAATGAAAFHFGNAVPLKEMLAVMPAEALVMGNVDPARQFCYGTPETIKAETLQILKECESYPNFVISSGCDIPPASSWENIRAFFETVSEYYA
jgi:uroporphyrinogen decarboxylase